MKNSTKTLSLKQFFSILLLLAICFSQPIFAKDSDSIKIVDAYARAVPPGQPNSAAFMKLENSSDKPISIINATSNTSKIVELHTHLHENGMMKMRRISEISVPAKSTIVLKPGGLHIMLIQLKDQLKPGQEVKLTVEFSDNSTQSLTIPVKKIHMHGMMKMKGMKH